MINATALRPVFAENMNVVSNVSNVLTKSSQNIKIEYSKQADLVPACGRESCTQNAQAGRRNQRLSQ